MVIIRACLERLVSVVFFNQKIFLLVVFIVKGLVSLHLVFGSSLDLYKYRDE